MSASNNVLSANREIYKVFGFSLLCAVLYCCVSVDDLNASLVAQYTFEGNANDVSGNGHHGIIIGDASIIDDPDRGRVLRNVNGRVNIHSTTMIPSFPANSSITLAAWVKREVRESGNYNYVIQVGRNGDNPIATLNILPNDRLRGYIETDLPGTNTDQVSVTSGLVVEASSAFVNWHHIAIVFDRSIDIAVTYIDGVSRGTTNISNLSDSHGFTWTSAGIGSDSDGTPVYKGLIDDVRIYDEALDAADIGFIMQTKDVVITPTELEITEGQSGACDISLREDPNQEIQFSVTPEDANLSLASGEIVGEPGETIVLTFDSGNWQSGQTVTVSAVDNDEGGGDITRSISFSINNPAYNPVGPVEVKILEDELICGDWGYSPMDFNKDCYVNLYDLVIFAAEWMTCTDPEGINCGSVKEFSLIALPDTQVYSESYPQHFIAQAQWIKDNVDELNIKYVLHLGDITDDNNTAQWNNAKTAISILDGVVPYALAPGNHDYGPNGNGSVRESYFFNDADNAVPYFGVGTPYTTQPNIGGFYTEPDSTVRTDNSSHTFSALGEDFLVIALEFGPRDAVVEWAETIVVAHPDHYVILITHAYMYYDDTRYDWATKGASQSWNPHSYGVASLPGGVNDGEELWQKLVKKYDNFIMTINGHVLNDGAARLTSTGDHGNKVHQILNNYQSGVTGSIEGGQGYLRIFTFKPDKKTVEVKTYSPVLDQYKTDSQHEFVLELSPGL